MQQKCSEETEKNCVSDGGPLNLGHVRPNSMNTRKSGHDHDLQRFQCAWQ